MLTATVPLAAAQPPQPTPVPHMDRLAIPSLPAHPTASQTGRFLYYFDCMPCHGDHGQGLTDEWRQAWVEDHQNCWGRGCHSGRPGDEGFPLPRFIPPVIGGAGALSGLADAGELEAYLRRTHPPQNPGGLADVDYRNLTAYLWEANGRQAGPQAPLTLASLVLLGAVLLTAWLAAWRRAAGS